MSSPISIPWPFGSGCTGRPAQNPVDLQLVLFHDVAAEHPAMDTVPFELLALAFARDAVRRRHEGRPRAPAIAVDPACDRRRGGLHPLRSQAANLMLSLVSSRYERASLIVTSNKPFSGWGRSSATRWSAS
jgi:hypothetical protein